MSSEQSSVAVRRATTRDAEAVRALLHQLGYTASAEDTAGRIRQTARSPRAFLSVATAGKTVVGVVSAVVSPYFPDGTDLCRVTALVVDQAHRGGGIGEALLDSALEFARQSGCAAVEVTTANARDRAHRFYEKMGFDQTSLRFYRAL
ncbi:MAG: GNAT family N-acetyltransferase [Alphaproteobacteria bacterium]|nr:GNAT family N-acetyltransferase [Alphaproteobacteria bacterium]